MKTRNDCIPCFARLKKGNDKCGQFGQCQHAQGNPEFVQECAAGVCFLLHVHPPTHINCIPEPRNQTPMMVRTTNEVSSSVKSAWIASLREAAKAFFINR